MTYTPAKLMQIYLNDVVQQGRLDLIPALAAPDMIDEANQAFGGPPGRDGLVAHVVGFRRNIGDLNISIERIVAGVDDVMACWRFTGVHQGPWLGRPATGGPISGTVFSFFDTKQGKISRYRVWLCAQFDQPVIFDSANPN